MALGEKCCFYVNNSGVIRETLAFIKQNVDQRELRNVLKPPTGMSPLSLGPHGSLLS